MKLINHIYKTKGYKSYQVEYRIVLCSGHEVVVHTTPELEMQLLQNGGKDLLISLLSKAVIKLLDKDLEHYSKHPIPIIDVEDNTTWVGEVQLHPWGGGSVKKKVMASDHNIPPQNQYSLLADAVLKGAKDFSSTQEAVKYFKLLDQSPGEFSNKTELKFPLKATGLNSSIIHEFAKLIPDITIKQVVCPACSNSSAMYSIAYLIQHLNDSAHKWEREAIADWLETLDADLNLLSLKGDKNDG